MPNDVTLSTLATKMGEWLSIDEGRMATSVRKDILNISIREICRDNDFHLNTDQSIVAVPAGTGAAAFIYQELAPIVAASPADTARPVALSYTKAGSTVPVPIDEVSKERLDFLFPDPAAQGDPTHFAIWRGTILLRPVPSSDIDLTIDYYGVPGNLTDDTPGVTDTSTFLQVAWELVFYLALTKASKWLLEDARAGLWEAEYKRLLPAFIRDDNRVGTSARRPVSSEPG